MKKLSLASRVWTLSIFFVLLAVVWFFPVLVIEFLERKITTATSLPFLYEKREKTKDGFLYHQATFGSLFFFETIELSWDFSWKQQELQVELAAKTDDLFIDSENFPLSYQEVTGWIQAKAQSSKLPIEDHLQLGVNHSSDVSKNGLFQDSELTLQGESLNEVRYKNLFVNLFLKKPLFKESVFLEGSFDCEEFSIKTDFLSLDKGFFHLEFNKNQVSQIQIQAVLNDEHELRVCGEIVPSDQGYLAEGQLEIDQFPIEFFSRGSSFSYPVEVYVQGHGLESRLCASWLQMMGLSLPLEGVISFDGYLNSEEAFFRTTIDQFSLRTPLGVLSTKESFSPEIRYRKGELTLVAPISQGTLGKVQDIEGVFEYGRGVLSSKKGRCSLSQGETSYQIEWNNGLLSLQTEIELKAQIALSVPDNSPFLEGEGIFSIRSVKFCGNMFSKRLLLSGAIDGTAWKISNLEFDDYQLHGEGSWGERIIIDRWNLVSPKIAVRGSGRELDKGWEVSLHPVILPFASQYRVALDEPLHVRIEKKGVQIENISCSLYDLLNKNLIALFEVPLFSIHFDSFEGISDQSHITIFSEHLRESITAEGTFTVGCEGVWFHSQKARGTYEVGKEMLLLQELSLAFKEEEGLFWSTISYGNKLFFAQGLFSNLEKRISIEPFDKSGLIELSFSKEGDLIDLQGEMPGCQFALKEKMGFLFLEKGELLASFLPPSFSFLSQIEGITLDGRWEGASFEGRIFGEVGKIFGYDIQNLKGHCKIDPKRVLLQNCEVQTVLGLLSLKKGAIIKEEEQWRFEVPLLQAHAVSLGSSPFCIRHLIVTEAKGVIGDPASFEGDVRFHFTNGTKKESSIFDMPIQMLKDLGFDWGMFTPVIGEVIGEIQDGKLILRALHGVVSEGGRSEFHLTHDISFIDQKGNLNIHLEVEQNVTFKLSEQITIHIEGDIDSPKYSIDL